MKNLLLTLLICAGFSLKASACSCSSNYPFCHAITYLQPNLIVSGVVVSFDATDTLSMKLSILETYKGQASHDTITIWSGTYDVMCGPMNVSNMGYEFNITDSLMPGDTLITMLTQITQANIQNSWEIPGDYKRPTWLCYSSTLSVRNDTVNGRIYGSYLTVGPPWWSVSSMPFSEFRASWSGDEFVCRAQVGIAETESQPLGLQPNPASGSVSIKLPSHAGFSGTYSLVISDVSGRQVQKVSFTASEHEADISQLPPGLYLLSIATANGQSWQQKLVVQR